MLKKYNQIWKRVEKLLKTEFNSKPVYGDDNKYIKTKKKNLMAVGMQIFNAKKYLKKKYHASVCQ